MINYSDVAIIKETGSIGNNFLISCGFRVIQINFKFKLLRFVIRLFKLYFSFWLKLLFNIDLKVLSKYSCIIMFDSSIEYIVCNVIQRNFHNKRLILYFWNKIDSKREKKIHHFKSKWQIYSYNNNDCCNFNLKYNKLFIPINNYIDKNISEIKQDVFFIGRNKGRIDELLKIITKFKEISVSYKVICVMKDKKHIKYYGEIIQTDTIPYEEVILEILSSKAILSIYNDNTDDVMTLRELEALFLKKKLITNNIMIKKQDYYHPNNIYIIDYSASNIFEGFKDFLEKPFTIIDDDILKSYSIHSWIQRFENIN